MPVTVFVKHLVADFDVWKKTFDERAEARSVHGCIAAKVFRDANAPNVIVVLARMKDIASAKRYMRQTDVLDGMWRAGVKDAPEVLYLDEVDDGAF
jgi:hypothetical protein